MVGNNLLNITIYLNILLYFQPVYRDEYYASPATVKTGNSQSFPDLRVLYADASPNTLRRRAMSECYERPAPRSSSDTDLTKIDKEATFAIANPIPPCDILATVVDALAQNEEMCEESETDDFEELGVQGFSDSEILKSEMFGSGWSLGGRSGGSEKCAVPPRVLRTRAASDIKVPNISRSDNSINDWTWSGPAASKKIEELRAKTKFNRPRARTKSEETTESGKSLLERLRNSFRRKRGEDDRKPSETEKPQEYLEKTADGRRSNISNISHQKSESSERYLARTRSGRHSVFSVPESKVLEETSVADLLRALTSLHSRIGAIPELPMEPQRKLGNAGLTPPKIPSSLDLFTASTNKRLQMRRASVNPSMLMSRRRFSLHPVTESELPPPPPYTPGFAALHQRRGSLIPTSTSSFGTGLVHKQVSRLRGNQVDDIPTSRTRHDSLRDIRIDK